MASVSSQPNRTLSHARTLLDYALGNKIVDLGELHPSEFDELLRNVLRNINLRSLRGFKPLRDKVEMRGSDDRIVLNEATQFETDSFQEHERYPDLKTHIAGFWHNENKIYRRLETNEETTDWKEALDWGFRQAYMHRGDRQMLALMRPRNHTRGDENLIEVQIWFEKVPHKNIHEITKIRVEKILFNRFRKHFGEKYPEIATTLIRNLGIMYKQTASSLESDAKHMAEEALRIHRIVDAVVA